MNGIGGRTIAEAKERISYPEFLTWVAYRRKRGPLNVSLRVDRGAALLASLYAIRHFEREGGGEFTVSDFMPFSDPPAPIDLETAMETWS